MKSIIIAGSGNAALSAGIAALERGAKVLMLEKADEPMSGGNTKYTAGAMRFAYNSGDELLPLLKDPQDPRLPNTDFGSYTREKFGSDLLGFNDGRPLSIEQETLVNESYDTVRWLSSHDVKFQPIYARQSFEKDGRHVFWGGLTLASDDEGVGLFDQELAAFTRMGGEIRYGTAVTELLHENGTVTGVKTSTDETFHADAVILACGGFEASDELRQKHIGPNWDKAKVRGTPHNTGDGLVMAEDLGAQSYGLYGGCHATPMDLHMKNFGNLDLPAGERKKYRKICYFLGVMLNADGQRFVDEGINFRNYTYAQFGAAIMDQPEHFAWQIFDAKVFDLLYDEYRFHDAHFVEADTLQELVQLLDGVDKDAATKTLADYNAAVNDTPFDPTILDGKGTTGLPLAKSNWAQKFDTGPYRAYPVTGGITFTYGGLKVNGEGAVMSKDDTPINGLFACGELVGGVFFNGYPGGSGLTSGAVFGRRAGYGAAKT